MVEHGSILQYFFGIYNSCINILQIDLLITKLISYFKIVALQERSFDDVFALQQVTQTEAENFNFVSGTVPVVLNMCLEVCLRNSLELNMS